jgi:hypothetical protein
MRIKGDHVSGWRHRISGILLVILIFTSLANVDALCADTIVDDANETQQLPAFDDSEIDAELPGHRNRSKTVAFAISSTKQVVKRIFDETTDLLVESVATVVPHYDPAAFITSFTDAPFRPPRLFT